MRAEFLKEYITLRNEIDSICNRLWDLHHSMMKCAKGCSMCCQAFKILPIEFHFIKEQIGRKQVETNKDIQPNQCKFLIDNACSIYENRPIICRTHGYPLTRFNEEADAYEVSFCELNFVDFPLEKFNRNNVFFEDKFNSKLYMLNKRFIKLFSKIRYDSIQLIELNNV